MSEQYELSTIKDIFNKVPTDRIEECCRELGQILTDTARLRDAMIGEMEMYGIIIPDGGLVKFPDSLEWIDDNKGDLTINVDIQRENGEREHLFSFKTKVGESYDSKTSTDKH